MDLRPELRCLSGSYHKPPQVVTQMVGLAALVLVTRLGPHGRLGQRLGRGGRPGEGPGTYQHSGIEHVLAWITERDGQGAAAGVDTQRARRLYGFELQMGPFAAAGLRAQGRHRVGGSLRGCLPCAYAR